MKSPGNMGKYGPGVSQSDCVITGQYGPIGNKELYWHIHYDFLNEDHMDSFHTNNYENSMR